MAGLDITQVEQQLVEIIRTERREAIGFTLVILLCTPLFVVLASIVGFFILINILGGADRDIDVRGIYTCINLFLAYMVVFVMRYSEPPEETGGFDKTWVASVVVFVLLLVLTYATRLLEQSPRFFGTVYAFGGFLVLGLLGRAQTEQPLRDEDDPESMFSSLVLVVPSFIAMSYGEVSRSSWLWFPPKPDELKLATWVLCRLVIEKDTSFKSQAVPRRILNMLIRLKLMQVTDRTLKLTLKGQDFLGVTGEAQRVVKK